AKHLLDKQRSIIRRALSAHGGRDVGGNLATGEETGLKGWLTGVGVKTRETKLESQESLLLFESALDATRCAVEIQRLLREYNREAPSNKDIYVRIGIHVGDVTERDGEVTGEAVAIASRVAPLAEACGICVSEKVYSSIRDKYELPIIRLGKQELKNLELPIEVYRLALPWEKQAAVEPASLDPHRLAILPLVNMISDPNHEYFADGMTEELISTTSSIKDLTVIARTSVMRYKGTTKGIEEIGKELGVGTVLEGSVRKAGNRLRITVQLINVHNQGHLWSQTYDREFDDVFAIQSDIAKQVADALRIKILPNETRQMERRPTQSTEAFTLYLRGRHLWNQRRREAVSKALGYFEKATKIDPGYALAYVGLADCYVILGDQGALPSSEAFPKARGLATKALELDDSMAEAHATLGTILEHEWDWVGAERELMRAIELNPGYPSAHQWYGVLLSNLGRYGESMSEMKKADELDPLSPVMRNNIAWSYFNERRYDEALAVFREVLDTYPDFRSAQNGIQSIYVAKSMFQEAVEEAQRARAKWPEAYWFLADNLAYCLAMAGRREEALRVVEDLVERSKAEYVSPFRIASAYIGIEKDKAFEWLEKGYEVHDGAMMYLKQDQLFRTLHSDPRYVGILRRMGLEK
ncbi:MAG: tetratricopeptide repeat protein, partial [Thaumarchaeota archaeon]|nr:tetratricopeptide repeat protein [Nitrososphaerota archaeon]